ncbi:VWA domain-containing protein [Pusillimonas sp. CC-YST705]|uniref:VWA domain-containing protein n=1 Tax=Mesopusillimonas faecipullorum TaxID=2755040 RepID=A0ABS8C8F8_9BURK|nr:VWA domain-containing protein [Mesopusillimonas faecipullorum]MCB5362305.1 VWA domain-containing protein [Mesopusillimonas faecipullorum]
MLIDFFYHLRRHKLPVSIPEYLTLLDALRANVMPPSLDEFYHLSKLALVKDETLYDRFDQAFGSFYQQLEAALPSGPDIPEDWLLKTFQKNLSPEEKAAIEKHGWQKLMELFKQRLDEQKERHAGGNKWIGTGGTSAFGHGGYHPEGIRIGGPSAGNRTAVKVWEQREFKDYDDQQLLGTRNFKMALRRLRRFARDGTELELDLDDTIASTARNAGMLDLQMVPERRNSVKVLMLLDVGGSMDDHITRVEELFSAARSEFRHLEVYYFHNCPYEGVWRDNRRRYDNRLPTRDLIRTYNEDWRLIFVGDATMSPYEILHPGGSVEHNNVESGAVWMRRLLDQWPKSIWLNPEPEGYWPYRQSISLMRQIMQDRMYGVTTAGIEQGMRWLSK